MSINKEYNKCRTCTDREDQQTNKPLSIARGMFVLI